MQETKKMKIQELISKNIKELIEYAEKNTEIKQPASLSRQDLMYHILRHLSGNNVQIVCRGTLEVTNEGFGFLRSAKYNYITSPDDIYVQGDSKENRFKNRG